MKIHTVKSDEGICDIASEYGTAEGLIRLDNELETGAPTVGEQLLIRTPTRTYKARYGDTADRLALRFQVDEEDISAQNPYINERALQPGDLVVLRQCEKKYGNAVSNGYFYRGCQEKLLSRALPYLTYVTIAAAILSEGKVEMTFDTKGIVKTVNEAKRIPLLRLHLQSRKLSPKCISAIIEAVEKNGFSGAVLPMQAMGEEYKNALCEMRGIFADRNLLFIIEADEETSPQLTNAADACFLSYYKFALDTPRSFDQCERSVYTNFASGSANPKLIIELPSMARCDDAFLKISDAIGLARKTRTDIKTDDGLLMRFNTNKGSWVFASPENIKATLDLIGECGYMGISFDIMRSPISHLLMYNELFKTVTAPTAKSREGCSKE